MPYSKLALFSLFFTACGTTIALLLGWYIGGPAMPKGALLLISMIGAVAGGFVGWRFVSQRFEFEAFEPEGANQ